MDTSSFVSLTVTSNINTFKTVRRFPIDCSIIQLKGKLELLTGASSRTMKIELHNKLNLRIAVLADDATLACYSVEDDMYLHVVDEKVNPGAFEDLSSVAKYEISEDSYDKRDSTFRAFKAKLKISDKEVSSKIDPNEKLERDKKLLENFNIGDRCEVEVSGKPKRFGTVMYKGQTDFQPGYFVGVKYDEPVGKNDGSVQGKHYFECDPCYGAFIRPHNVKICDMPEEEEIDEI